MLFLVNITSYIKFKISSNLKLIVVFLNECELPLYVN